MKITGLEALVLQFRSGRVIRDAIHSFVDPCGVVTKVHTDEGITGWGYSYFGTSREAAWVLKLMLERQLAPVITGLDPFYPKLIRERLWQATEYHGVVGLAHFGISAIDLAVWDIMGKAVGMPVYKLLGAHRDRIPAYAMVGWYFDSDEEYAQQCIDAVEEGFSAVKLKVGMGTLSDDLRRIKVAREAVGPEIRLMVDANQVFDEREALRRGRAYEKYDLFWFEEPLAPQFKNALGRLAAALDIPIATGENDYTKYAFLDLIQKGGVDIIQPDNRRAGGVTEWMEIAAIADAHGIKVASHGGGAANVNMLCAMPNAIYLESGSLKNDRMHVEQLELVDGCVLAPKLPGLGTEIRQDFIDEHLADEP
ncbi:MAG: mandelate racemase/muconate lactonizing enzyme family protein [Firmicutes bacterium]|jgi:L-alanine-DL-glutamate epimerase-like enolase superfamily enzyme|nr:mandelate racemase/muconate lactonizing enzyme family protein [Bacillota bacterium]